MINNLISTFMYYNASFLTWREVNDLTSRVKQFEETIGLSNRLVFGQKIDHGPQNNLVRTKVPISTVISFSWSLADHPWLPFDHRDHHRWADTITSIIIIIAHLDQWSWSSLPNITIYQAKWPLSSRSSPPTIHIDRRMIIITNH